MHASLSQQQGRSKFCDIPGALQAGAHLQDGMHPYQSSRVVQRFVRFTALCNLGTHLQDGSDGGAEGQGRAVAQLVKGRQQAVGQHREGGML